MRRFSDEKAEKETREAVDSQDWDYRWQQVPVRCNKKSFPLWSYSTATIVTELTAILMQIYICLFLFWQINRLFAEDAGGRYERNDVSWPLGTTDFDPLPFFTGSDNGAKIYLHRFSEWRRYKWVVVNAVEYLFDNFVLFP